MSSHYTNEPAATASATLHTTVGPIHIALFAKQAPLTCKNFLQHCKDNYYAGTIFHRIVPDFIIQGGDPSGTGAGGTSIYEYPEFEYDPEGRDPTEKVVLRDELHSRLRFNRRGMVGMAKSEEDGSYGSQFFITLANAERELNGKCTLFGRVEGDSIFSVLKIAEAERVEGSERPVYPVKVTRCEVGELGPLEGKLKDRQVTAAAKDKQDGGKTALQKKGKKKGKAGKVLLSFGADEGDDEGMSVQPAKAKPKYNPRLVVDAAADTTTTMKATAQEPTAAPADAARETERVSRKRPRSPSPTSRRESKEAAHPGRHRPKTPDPLTQLPLPDPESPVRSPSPVTSPPARQSILSRTNAQIESLKASMRRTVHAAPIETNRKKSALEAMIPEHAIRGRKRPAPGAAGPVAGSSSTGGSGMNGTLGFGGGGNGNGSAADNEALRLFNAFKAKLESADAGPGSTSSSREKKLIRRKEKHETNIGGDEDKAKREGEQEEEDEEAQLCDLHFIANCQSCKAWDVAPAATTTTTKDKARGSDGHLKGGGDDEEKEDDDDDDSWLTHELRFGKDTLGKDLSWKKDHPDDADSLVVIDPREKARELGARRGGDHAGSRGSANVPNVSGGLGNERDRRRERMMVTGAAAATREWDRTIGDERRRDGGVDDGYQERPRSRERGRR